VSDTSGEPPDDYYAQPRPKQPKPPEPPPVEPDPYGPPPPWGQPPNYSQPPGYGQHPVWGQPPGWTPPPTDRPVHLQVAEFFLGLVTCVAINVLSVVAFARLVLSDIGPFVLVVLNAVAIVVPAIKGHKSFSAGFAAGYGVIVAIGVVACFAFFANLPGA